MDITWQLLVGLDISLNLYYAFVLLMFYVVARCAPTRGVIGGFLLFALLAAIYLGAYIGYSLTGLGVVWIPFGTLMVFAILVWPGVLYELTESTFGEAIEIALEARHWHQTKKRTG